MKNKVFIATSLDGYIADKNGNIDWLQKIPNPTQNDMGYQEFISQVDAIIMGRKTFETICGFNIDWPYTKPVFVLTNTLKDVPIGFEDKIDFVKGDLRNVIANVHEKGYFNLYIDGGKTIQRFLKEDLIDELTITIIPYLLGDGVSLFSKMTTRLLFECVDSKIYLNKIVQNKFKRTKNN